ncbi:MAG: hypothetical protein KGI00_02760 [Candidatus Micrarchaeota archaeon]|nr:hypothetical protein [Candidatus Micrarchaeota archaeon]MDE1824553.1 hypothetical protein [Candidatus Micrarchaeota archaeon]MDE1849628.1 hypothetical protein [Candidatus Micrarchaeota archaeon]
MGAKGNQRHVKRIASNRYLHVERKIKKYVMKPNAGRHTGSSSIALSTVLKEKLMLAKNSFEANKALKSGSIEVNGRAVHDGRYPVGFGDIIHIKPARESFTVYVGKKGVVDFRKHSGKEEQAFKVIGKYLTNGRKIMVRLHNGNVLEGSKDVMVNDSVTLKNGSIDKVMKLKEGASCLVIKGVHASESGTIRSIKKGTATRPPTVEIEGKKGSAETLLDNIMVVGG